MQSLYCKPSGDGPVITAVEAETGGEPIRVMEIARFGRTAVVIPEVTGSAYIIGEHRFYFNPENSLNGDFIFR